ncbi:signal peptidase I [Rhodoligotrophos ferricapiens]|uniref:signal peptidase I n=1 Tax=Rhodoligotrophos ferricapiens TaxID=3069264 RepID=UPI00315D2542
MTSMTEHSEKKAAGGAWELIRVIVHALIIAFVIRTFLFQPFNIPSGSMIPTLLVGDYLFVSKFAYGYSRYSFTFSLDMFGNRVFKIGPLPFNGRILASQPERGDVAVFKLPTDNETDYIKRVIGLPGDHIQVQSGVLYINGEPVKRELAGDVMQPDAYGTERPVRRYKETLPNGVSYFTLDLYDNSPGDNTREYVVPPGHYFMMGDNRDNSTDSRFLGQVGYVPFENFVGKAEIIFFSHEPDASLLAVWDWPWVIRWDRFFTLLH